MKNQSSVTTYSTTSICLHWPRCSPISQCYSILHNLALTDASVFRTQSLACSYHEFMNSVIHDARATNFKGLHGSGCQLADSVWIGLYSEIHSNTKHWSVERDWQCLVSYLSHGIRSSLIVTRIARDDRQLRDGSILVKLNCSHVLNNMLEWCGTISSPTQTTNDVFGCILLAWTFWTSIPTTVFEVVQTQMQQTLLQNHCFLIRIPTAIHRPNRTLYRKQMSL